MKLGRLLLACSALAACDPSAKTATRADVSEDRRSLTYESCARTADCAGELRCLDGVCKRPTGSVQGEYQAAVAERASREGRGEAALDAFAKSVSHYDDDKLEPPADLYCRYGAVLLAQPQLSPQQSDLTARVFHKCVLGSPIGSALRKKAMAGLAVLSDHGLDPMLLSRGETADQYMTLAPAAPPTDSLTVEVSLKSGSRSSSVSKLADGLSANPGLSQALVGCWELHFKKTRKTDLTVELAILYGFDLDQYDDFKSSYAKVADSAPPADANEAAVVQCARSALAPIIEAEGAKIGREARWDATATFAVRSAE